LALNFATKDKIGRQNKDEKLGIVIGQLKCILSNNVQCNTLYGFGFYCDVNERMMRQCPVLSLCDGGSDWWEKQMPPSSYFGLRGIPSSWALQNALSCWCCALKFYYFKEALLGKGVTGKDKESELRMVEDVVIEKGSYICKLCRFIKNKKFEGKFVN